MISTLAPAGGWAFEALPRAGVTALGTNTNLPAVGAYGLPGIDNEFPTAPVVVDAANGHGYAVTSMSLIKFALNAGTAAPTRLASITWNNLGSTPSVLLDDSTNGHLYIVTRTFPVTIMKVDKGVGSAAPEILESVTVRDFDSDVSAGAIDSANGVAYFSGSMGGAARFFKMRLDPMELVGGVSPEGMTSISGVYLDTAKGLGYTHTSAGTDRYVHKFDLGATISTPPSYIGSTLLDPTDNTLAGGFIDTANDLIYLSTSQSTGVGRIIKVATGGIDDLPTRLSSLDLATGENWLTRIVFDPVNNIGYVGSRQFVTRVMKINWGIGAAAPTKIGTTLQLAYPESSISNVSFDATTGYLYATASGIFPYIVKINGGAPAASPTRASALPLAMDSPHNADAAFDTVNGHIYTIGYSEEGLRIMKWKTSEDPNTPPSRINVITAPGEIMEPRDVVINPATGYGYAISYNRYVIKFRMGVGDAPCELVGVYEYGTEHAIPHSLVIDPVNNHGYIGTFSSPGQILKIDLGVGDALPSLISSLVFASGNIYLESAIPDHVNRVIYFMARSAVVKVAMTDGAAAPLHVGDMPIVAGETKFCGGALDLANGHGYFSVNNTPGGGGRIVKANLNDPASAPTRIGQLSVPYAADSLVVLLDHDRRVGYMAGYSSPSSYLPSFTMGDGATIPTYRGFFEIGGQGIIRGGYLDPNTGIVTLSGGDADSARIARYTTWASNRVHHTKMTLSRDSLIQSFNFYSHSAEGNLRFAIYDNATPEQQLLWESPEIANTTANGWITVPIAGGSTDTLSLDAGTYWLSWITDSKEMVGSYVTGVYNTGNNFVAPFGNFPQSADRKFYEGSTDYGFSSYVEYVAEPILTAITLADRDQLNTPIAGYTNEATVRVTFTYTNGPVEYIHLSEDETFASYMEVLSPLTGVPVEFTFSNTTDGTKTLYARVGNSMGTSAGVSGSIILDTVPPTVTANTLLTNNRRPALSGTVTDDVAVARVLLTVGGQNRTASLGVGTWSLGVNSLTTLTDGEYDILATAVDRAGNATLDSTTNELEVDGTGPVVVAPVGNGGVAFTNNTNVTFTWSTPTDINGIGTLTLQVGTFSGGNSVFNGSVLGLNEQSVTGANGQTLHARLIATDSLGNATTGPNAGTVTVDTVAPAAPTGLDLLAADDTGASNTDNITRNKTGLTIRGTAEVQSTVRLYHGGDELASGTQIAFNSPGLDIAIPTDGVYTIEARATDRAGNEGAAASINITIDSTAPTVNIDTPTTQVAGNIFGDYAISDSYGLSGTPTLYVRRPTGNWATSGVAVSAPGGTFEYTSVSEDGPYHFTIVATDVAGNSIAVPTGGIGLGQSTTFLNANNDGSISFTVPTSGIYIYPLTDTTWAELEFIGLSSAVGLTVACSDSFGAPSGYGLTDVVGERLSINVTSGTLTGSVMVRWHVDPTIFAAYGHTMNRVLKYNSGVLAATYPVVPDVNPVEFGPLTGFSDFFLTEENLGIADWSILTD